MYRLSQKDREWFYGKDKTETLYKERRSPLLNGVITFTLYMVMVAIAVLGFSRLCCAQSDKRTALALVQCIRAECNSCHRKDEKEMMAHVLRKLSVARHVSMYQQTTEYCAVFNRHNARAIRITDSTFAKPLVGTRKWWRKMHHWARLFLAGKIPDPEPTIEHWGCNTDTYRMVGWTLVRSWCAPNGKLCTHGWSK